MCAHQEHIRMTDYRCANIATAIFSALIVPRGDLRWGAHQVILGGTDFEHFIIHGRPLLFLKGVVQGRLQDTRSVPQLPRIRRKTTMLIATKRALLIGRRRVLSPVVLGPLGRHWVTTWFFGLVYFHINILDSVDLDRVIVIVLVVPKRSMIISSLILARCSS